MKTSYIVGIIILIVVAVGGWYAWSTGALKSAFRLDESSNALGVKDSPDQGNLGEPDADSVQKPEESAKNTGGLTLGVITDTKLGKYLIGNNGKTLYTYAKDTPGVSTCSGTCAQNWPPYTVPPDMIFNLEAEVAGGANSMIRADGKVQVTYNGMPLYFYKGDTVSGDAKGHGVGGLWSVVKP